jgi:hypothetical protein
MKKDSAHQYLSTSRKTVDTDTVDTGSVDTGSVGPVIGAEC